jgi:hypothetical protein
MKDKLLNELLELLEPRRPRFGVIRAMIRVEGITELQGKRWYNLTHNELELTLRLCEKDRQLAKLQKPKAKAKKKA